MAGLAKSATGAGLRSDDNARGIFYLCCGLFVFAFQDVIIKLLSSTYPVQQLVFMRSMVAMPLLLALVHFDSGFGSLRTSSFFWHALRACLQFSSYLFYYLAIASIPITTVVSLFFTSPLLITALAVPVLGEKVGAKRWFGVAVGFCGVLVMLRPGSAVFEPAAILALISAVTYSCSQVLARRLGAKDSASVMAFYSMCIYAYIGGGLSFVVHFLGLEPNGNPSVDFFVRPWTMPTGLELAMMMTTGLISAFGFYLLSQAYRTGAANAVAPFEYTAMLWAVILTYLVFGTVPDIWTLVGAVIIVASGIYVLRRESVTRDLPLAAKGPYRSR